MPVVHSLRKNMYDIVCKDPETRFAWDLFHLANLSNFAVTVLYKKDCNDTHIETALKKIVKEVLQEVFEKEKTKMKYKVKVPDQHEFVRMMRVKYLDNPNDYGDMEVKALSKKGVVSIIQNGNGLNPVDLIDSVLDETGGEYI